MKKLILLLLLPLSIFAQDSWVNFKVQYDFYAPTESNFFMVEDTVLGDTVMFHQPTVAYEFLDTTILLNSGNYVITLIDNYGDGWISNQPAWFKMMNDCQGPIVDFNPLTAVFFTLDTLVNIWPCAPPAPAVCVPALLSLNLDQFPVETTWEIKDTSGNVIESGGPYSANYQQLSIPLCLPIAPVSFTITDTYGDGMAGSLWGGQDGSYYITQCYDTLVDGSIANFAFDSTHYFISDTCTPIFGCMDPLYIDFNPQADTSDGSCLTLISYGCIDDSMYNWNPLANTMELIPNCDYTLTLYDLMGDGWVGSYLEVVQGLDTNQYVLTSGFQQSFTINLNAPQAVSFKFFITTQAQLTAAHCGFKLTNPLGDSIIEIPAPFLLPLSTHITNTYCGNTCIEKVFGCTYPLAINYDSLANTDDVSCYYNPGCTNPVYLEYDATYDQEDGSCSTLVVIGCMDSTAFNYVDTANTELPNSCIAVVEGCMQALAFNYNINANTSDTCIAVVYGCMSQIAFNYDSLANTDDGSCIGVTYGCTDTLAFNWDPTANVDDNSCVPIIYGCINPTMFNFDTTANTNDGTCIPFIFGCTDSTMFNFNILANADNNSCSPYVYGCTDPSSLNYNATANTEDFSCIPYIYGCADSTALNYDTLVNTDNGSCVEVVEGCLDPMAFNYNSNVNVADSLSCLYSANCITGDSIPYWLNDPCYAWVIDVDDYCCDNTWDDVCQLTYDYCDGTYIGDIPARLSSTRKLISITDLLGRPTKEITNTLLFYIYDDGSVEKKLIK